MLAKGAGLTYNLTGPQPSYLMYKIIGADQKEYGPVSGEQLRQWIAEGRVSGQTMVQSEGDPNWRPLA